MNSNKASSSTRQQHLTRGLSLMSALSLRGHRTLSTTELNALPDLSDDEIAAMEMCGADMGQFEAYDMQMDISTTHQAAVSHYTPHVAYRSRLNIGLRLSRGIRREFVPYIGAMCRKCCADATRITKKEHRPPPLQGYSTTLLNGS